MEKVGITNHNTEVKLWAFVKTGVYYITQSNFGGRIVSVGFTQPPFNSNTVAVFKIKIKKP